MPVMVRGNMNIILVSNNMAKARTLSLLQVSVIVFALVFVPILLALMLIDPSVSSEQTRAISLLPKHLHFSFHNPQKHLDAYALQLGEMQARMMQLDAQSERLTRLAGEKAAVRTNAQDERSRDAQRNRRAGPNLGGPLVLTSPMSEKELQKEIANMMVQIEYETDYLNDLEAKLLQQSVFKDMLPNSSPVAAAYNSSSYGWRIDPFSGNKAFHEGLDFTASTGAPIYAAAEGIVSSAEVTPDYGRIIKVDHGAGLETRYAHASRLLVSAGERVKKGQKIAEVGSTGRSTGPHLHYEIRLHGSPLDPRKYLGARK